MSIRTVVRKFPYSDRLFENKGDFCLIGQFFLRLALINFTSGSGRLEKADEDFKK